MAFVWTFLEGLASFASPCMLPLMPVFAAYFAGARAQRGLARAIAFVLGFTCIFMLLGVFAASIGLFFAAHRTSVSVVSGALVIVFGLAFLDVIRLPSLHLSPSPSPSPSLFPAFAFGLLYALNLTPCVGAFLAAALAAAAESGTAWKGAALLASYSAGFGIPFIIAGVALSRLNGIFNKIKTSYNVLVPVCGGMLVLFGVWMVAKPFAKPSASVDAGLPSASAVSETKEIKPMEITSKDVFTAEVLKSDKPAIVDFWAPWCGPCRMMGPVLEEVAAARTGLKVCKVNVDELGELAQEYMITSIPCVILFRNGAAAARSVGYVGKDELLHTLGL